MTQVKPCLRCGRTVSPDMKFFCEEGDACPVFGAGEDKLEGVHGVFPGDRPPPLSKPFSRCQIHYKPTPKTSAPQAFLREVVLRDAILSAQIAALTRLVTLNQDRASMSGGRSLDAARVYETAAGNYALLITKIEENHRADCNAMRLAWAVDTLQVEPLSERQIAALRYGTRGTP